MTRFLFAFIVFVGYWLLMLVVNQAEPFTPADWAAIVFCWFVCAILMRPWIRKEFKFGCFHFWRHRHKTTAGYRYCDQCWRETWKFREIPDD